MTDQPLTEVALTDIGHTALLQESGTPGSTFHRRMAFPRSWRRRVPLVAGSVIVGGWILAGVFAPLISPYDPSTQDLLHALAPPFSGGHLLGTDQYGRDVLTRIEYSARIDALIAFGATGVSFLIGSTIGLCAGFYGGWVDKVTMRIVDIFFAFPFLVLVLAIIAVLGPGLLNMFIAMWLTNWPSYTRLVRGEVLVAKRQEYVLAAEALGYRSWRIALRHLAPNVITSSLTFMMINAVYNLGLGAFLGYLGLGVQDPVVEWGKMIADGKSFMLTNWWLSTLPGIAIVTFGLGLSLIGEGMTTALRTGRNER
jgi:peptide/nickel transport system permease protein